MPQVEELLLSLSGGSISSISGGKPLEKYYSKKYLNNVVNKTKSMKFTLGMAPAAKTKMQL